MPTAQDLYKDILDFLARGTSPGSPDGPHGIASGASFPAAPRWNSPPPLLHVSNGLLPTCALGTGERSPHAKLHAYLANLIAASGTPKYFVVSEFPLVKSTGRSGEAVDAAVFDDNRNLIAAIELKHYSVHQNKYAGMIGLLMPPNAFNSQALKAPSHPRQCLDLDFDKRRGRALLFPGTPRLVNDVPLIQVGLLTAIHDARGAGASVNFVAKYAPAPPHEMGPLSDPKSTRSLRWFANAASDVDAWWRATVIPSPSLLPTLPAPHARYSMQHADWGWGPEESFVIPTRGAPVVTVHGRVGYVCVMTK